MIVCIWCLCLGHRFWNLAFFCCNFNKLTYLLTGAGSAADVAVLGDYAKEDSELCTQRAREAGDSERRSSRRRQPRRHSGGRIRQAGREDDLHPCLSAEDATTSKHRELAYFATTTTTHLMALLCLSLLWFIACSLLHFTWVVEHEKCIVVTRICVSVRGRMPTLCNLGVWSGMPSSCAVLGGFAIGARVALLWQHYWNAWQSPAVILQAHRTHAAHTHTTHAGEDSPRRR